MSHHLNFGKIYDEYYPKILSYLTRIAGENDSEDLAQVVFDKVNKGLPGFQADSKLSTWIYRIATHTAIDKFRSAKYRYSKNNVAIDDVPDQVSEEIPEDLKSPSSDKLLIKKEMNECINEYIDTLPPDYKTIIILSELEGLTNNEIAEILEISLDNVKIRLHRARTKLKAVLNKACDFYYTDENTLACDRKQVQILPKVKS